jgi:hypothetical protein
VFVVGEHNLRSQKALEKIGAKFLRATDPDANGQRKVIFAMTR